jgi:hypothetical protein
VGVQKKDNNAKAPNRCRKHCRGSMHHGMDHPARTANAETASDRWEEHRVSAFTFPCGCLTIPFGFDPPAPAWGT